MPLWTRLALSQQLARVKAAGWLKYYEQAAGKYGFTVPLMLGLTSRETNCKNIIGDNGHGHGLGQIDDRSYPVWCERGLWKDPQEALRMSAAVLQEKIRQISPSVPANDRLRVGLVAYNAGAHHAVHDYFAGEPDRHTTGRDYSKDVLKRSGVFAELLGGEGDAMGKVGAVVHGDGRD